MFDKPKCGAAPEERMENVKDKDTEAESKAKAEADKAKAEPAAVGKTTVAEPAGPPQKAAGRSAVAGIADEATKEKPHGVASNCVAEERTRQAASAKAKGVARLPQKLGAAPAKVQATALVVPGYANGQASHEGGRQACGQGDSEGIAGICAEQALGCGDPRHIPKRLK